MIEFVNVTKVVSSGGAKANILREVSLVLPTDKRIAILGLRGSGKTTLIRLLSGISVPSVGVIRREVRASFPAGFTGGATSKHPARHQIRHAAEIYGADPDEVLSFVSALPGLGQELEQPMNRLAPQTRLCLGYALCYAIPFDVYLIDNMISVGDPQFKRLCESMYLERSKTGGMIIATHNYNSVKELADIGGIIHNGTLKLYPDLESAIEVFRGIVRIENQPPRN